MGTQPTIISGALASLDRHLWRRGIDCSALAQDCGISDEALLLPETEIPLTGFVRVYEEGADRTGNADLGWSTGADFDMACLGDIGRAILAAPTLGVALKTFSDFTQLIQSASEIRLSVEGSEAVLSYRILDPDIWPRRQDAEFTMSIFHHLIRRCAGAGFRPTMIAFEHDAARAEQEIRDSAGCDCVFGQLTNAIGFPASLLDRPMPTAESDRHRAAQQQLAACLRDQLRQMPAGARVETAILRSLGTQPTDQASIARAIGFSKRTLHRRLVDEGTSFSRLLEACRLRMACHALMRSDRSIADIAFDLGYSDQSAFGRAFRRGKGVSPQRFRDAAAQRPTDA